MGSFGQSWLQPLGVRESQTCPPSLIRRGPQPIRSTQRCQSTASKTLNNSHALHWSNRPMIRQMSLVSNRNGVFNHHTATELKNACDRRAQLLLDLRMHLQRFGGNAENSQRIACDVARTLNTMGRHWEAEAWAAIATTLRDDKDPGVNELRQKIIADLKRNQQWNSIPDLSALDPLAQRRSTDIAHTDSPTDSQSHSLDSSIVDPPTTGVDRELHLADETRSRNLVVPTVRYPDLASSLIHSMGTGGGTIDFDLDGWSDLVLAATNEPPDEVSSNPNMLLRNFNGRFGDVSSHANGGTGFGQGVAVGDYNEDGFPDIFFANVGTNRLLRNNGDGTFSDVTGFAREYNIYYEQQPTAFWVDRSARQGLIEPTRMTVGFGTQAIDLDVDGIDELAITNGHIGDFGPSQPPPAQPFQLLRRSKDGIFELVDMSNDNAYLSTNHIGRALWKIDVNRDLADDLVVTHQNAPPALLVNQTETDNRRVAFQCVGTTSSRDAIGTVVHFVAYGRRRAVWLLSGDGYMSSNERILKAAIGSSDQADDVSVTWPSGRIESFGTIAAGQTVLLVEGSGEAFVCD